MPKQKLIGIIDDDPDLPTAISSLVRSMGYQAECFSSAVDFLNRSGFDAYSCVISDIHMPVVTGLELTRRLKTMAPELPVILMTGRPELGLEEMALRSGAVSFVAKPFSTNVLIENLAKIFGKSS
jgi:FixJ family two-component response regulator